VVDQVGVEPDTPKALANWSPGLLQPWGNKWNLIRTLKAFGWDEPFQGYGNFCSVPQGWRCAPTAGLELVNAFGVPHLTAN